MEDRHFSNTLFLWIVVNVIGIMCIKTTPLEDFTDIQKGHIACHCGKTEKIMEKDLDIKTTRKLFREVANHKDFLVKIHNFEEVKEFSGCKWCNLTYIKSVNISRTVGDRPAYVPRLIDNPIGDISRKVDDRPLYVPQLTDIPIVNISRTVDDRPAYVPRLIDIQIVNNSRTVDDRSTSAYIPRLIDIPIGGHKNHSRLPRFVGCSYPAAMETAAISCRVYPSSIKCVERCAYGYTLENGIRKDIHCNFKNNQWIPSGFKECLPFVDCSVTLTSGGSTTCEAASVDKAPVCKIECLHYEDKPEVPMAFYRCKIDGTWEPPLPFCVIPGSGLVLASAPKVKLHND